LPADRPLDVHFTVKGDSKSTVSIQLRGLPDRETADEQRLFWGERLDRLKQVLPEA
jgi:hypothetical protein